MRLSRRPLVPPAIAWAAIAAAVIVHGGLLALLYVSQFSFIDPGFGLARAASAPPPPPVELKSTCAGDAAFALVARTAMCAAPWRDDVEDCASDAQMTLWMDLSGCIGRDEPLATAVAMIDGKTAARIKEIDPEKLLDTPPEQTPTPPKPQELPPPLPQNTPPPPPPPPPRPQQVVETVKPQQEQAPDNARLLSEYDTKVEHETVNRGAANEPMVAKAKPADLQPTTKPPDEDPHIQKLHDDRAPGHDLRAPDAPGMLSMRNPGLQHPAEVAQEQKTRGDRGATPGVATADGLAHRRGDGQIEQEKLDPSEQPAGQGGAGGGAPQVPNLQPSKEQLERALGGGNVDHLDDVDNGDETALSSKRWIYASFFNRLKRQVAQNWDPASVWRRGDPSGQVWGFKTRVTEVRVTLTPTGELTKIVVTSSCGVGDLDDEAIRAFHAAAPFPNPPEGLVSEKTKLITFAFSFFFEIGSPHTSWRQISS